jgi:methylthioribose-1-phosphate isomerase
MFKSIEFKDDVLILLDQRKLPNVEEYFHCHNLEQVIYSISDMVVRGAPAIGASAAFGVLFAYKESSNYDQFIKKCEDLVNARPTAVNLKWAVERMTVGINSDNFIDKEDLLLQLAIEIYEEDIKINKTMAKYGNELIKKGDKILTHCNTGALATVDYGTALGVIREAHFSGKEIFVYADETRPRLQGARLTAWELIKEGIPSMLLPDGASGILMESGEVNIIFVGADRIALNGDTANKIGTFNLAIVAKYFNIPFYVVAPSSTFDLKMNSGKMIEIEFRNEDEIKTIEGIQIAPKEIRGFNPSFDVTHNELIAGIVTEKGIIYPPFSENIRKVLG